VFKKQRIVFLYANLTKRRVMGGGLLFISLQTRPVVLPRARELWIRVRTPTRRSIIAAGSPVKAQLVYRGGHLNHLRLFYEQPFIPKTYYEPETEQLPPGPRMATQGARGGSHVRSLNPPRRARRACERR